MHWQKIALIGVGLLGGSLGLAIKQRKLAPRVIGFVRRSASVKECEAEVRKLIVEADVLCGVLTRLEKSLKEREDAVEADLERESTLVENLGTGRANSS